MWAVFQLYSRTSLQKLNQDGNNIALRPEQLVIFNCLQVKRGSESMKIWKYPFMCKGADFIYTTQKDFENLGSSDEWTAPLCFEDLCYLNSKKVEKQI
jgi:hypothetical protein